MRAAAPLPAYSALVTGGTGFIGTRLVAALAGGGCHVRTLSRGVTTRNAVPGADAIYGDVRDRDVAARAARGINVIFHLAAWNGAPQAGADEEALAATNVEGTRHLLEAARAAAVRRFVHFSSVKAQGETTGDERQAPATAYGRSRLAAERLVLDAAQSSALEVCCLRLPMVWGPGHRGNLYRMLAAIDRGVFPPLPLLENRRSLVHIEDVVQAALLAAVHPAAAGKVYTVTDGCAYSGTELYEMLSAALGRVPPAWRVPVPVLKSVARVGDVIQRIARRPVPFDSGALVKLIESAHYDCAAIVADLGYHPQVTVREGLPGFVGWYRYRHAG